MWSLCKDTPCIMCPKNCRYGVLFIKGIFTNVYTEIHSIFPDIVLTITSSSIFLRQRPVVRQRHSALPLTASRSHS